MGHICLYVNAYIAVQCLLSGNNAVVLDISYLILIYHVYTYKKKEWYNWIIASSPSHASGLKINIIGL